MIYQTKCKGGISIHKALTSLDNNNMAYAPTGFDFNPQGSHEPRQFFEKNPVSGNCISIHKALTSLDICISFFIASTRPFQSTRLSRASTKNWRTLTRHLGFQSTRLSRASTVSFFYYKFKNYDFNPQGSHEPRQHRRKPI